jgi:hypothetical protein
MAVVVAVVALVLSAGAGATASMMITGKQIKNNTVTTKDIKNRTLKAKDFSLGAKNKLRGATGPAGAAGPAGPAGASGISGFELVTKSLSIPVALPGQSGTTFSAACPAGKKALSATASYAAPLQNLLSQVTRTGDSAFSATGLNLTALTGQLLTLEVVCAAIPS